MPELRPFRGLTFARAGADPGHCLSRPAVHEGPPPPASGDEPPVPGVRPLLFPSPSVHPAADLAASWRRNGDLRRDDVPCWYLLSQSFRTAAGLVERMGLVALCRMGEAGSGWISSFQQTWPPLLEAAVRRLRITRLHVEPIVLLDPAAPVCISRVAAAARGQAPVLEALFDRSIHRLWRVPAEDVPDLAGCAAGGSTPFLAGGHHLYHAAQTFRDIMRLERRSGEAPWDFVPAVLFPQDPATVEIRTSVILAGRSVSPDWERLHPALARSFAITPHESLPVLAEAVRGAPGFACGVFTRDRRYLLTGAPLGFREGRDLLLGLLGGAEEGAAPPEGTPAWLGNPEEAEAVLLRRPHDIGLLLKPPRMDDLLRAARDRALLPPLSVSVGPEVPAGFLLAALDEWVP